MSQPKSQRQMFIKGGEPQKMTGEDLERLIDPNNPDEEERGTKVVTICKNCVFAEFEPDPDDLNINRQTGCYLGRLEQFHKIGTEILLVEEPDIDTETDKELPTATRFHVIQGRICTALREQAWVDIQIAKREPSEEYEGNGREGIYQHELAEAAIEESCVQNNTTMILYIPDGTEWPAVASYIDGLLKHKKMVSHLIFMNASRKMLPIPFTHDIQHNYPNPPFKWRMEYILKGTHHPDIKSLLHQCIDIAVKKTQTVYYLFGHIDRPITEEYINQIETTLNVELEPTLMIHQDDEQGLFSQTRLHKMVGGFNEDSYIAKLTRIAEGQECPNLVKTFQSLQS